MLKNFQRITPLLRGWVAYAMLPAVGLLTAPLLARALGPEGRGQLAGILQPLVLASAIAALGIPSATIYFVGKKYSVRSITSIARLISAGTTSLVAIALLVYATTVSNKIGVNLLELLIIWAAFLPSAFIATRRATLQGLLSYRYIDAERALGAIFRVLVVVALWGSGTSSAVAFAVGYMTAGLIASSVLYLPRYQTKMGAHIQSRKFFNYALKSSFGTIAVVISGRLDQALLPAAVGSVELGYFSVAVAVAEVPMIVSAVASRNVMAESSAGYSNGRILQTIVLGFVALSSVVSAIYLSAPTVVPYLFGHAFVESTKIVQILLLSSFVAYWSICASSYLAGRGAPGLSSVGPAVGGAFTAILFFVFWSSMTVTLAAWVSVASQAASLLASATIMFWISRL